MYFLRQLFYTVLFYTLGLLHPAYKTWTVLKDENALRDDDGVHVRLLKY